MNKPKFKKGDRVRCIHREYGNETVGKIYTVVDWYDDGLTFAVEADDNGYANSYHAKHFELVNRPSTRNLPSWF